MDDLLQKKWTPEGIKCVCGLDEAGRGPLAGPVFAGAVILPDGVCPDGLNDSKKLSEKKRELLFDEICRIAIAWGVGTASPAEIDEINILNASLLAMRRAVESLSVRPDFLFVDGNIARGFSIPAQAVVKGDSLLPCIAAASIVAKVLRDRYCVEIDRKDPRYGFARHKGYPTKSHYEALLQFGPSEFHRTSFLKNLKEHGSH